MCNGGLAVSHHRFVFANTFPCTWPLERMCYNERIGHQHRLPVGVKLGCRGRKVNQSVSALKQTKLWWNRMADSIKIKLFTAWGFLWRECVCVCVGAADDTDVSMAGPAVRSGLSSGSELRWRHQLAMRRVPHERFCCLQPNLFIITTSSGERLDQFLPPFHCPSKPGSAPLKKKQSRIALIFLKTVFPLCSSLLIWWEQAFDSDFISEGLHISAKLLAFIRAFQDCTKLI